MAVCTSSSAFLAFWIMALAASALVMAHPLSFIFLASSNMDIPSFRASELSSLLSKSTTSLSSASPSPLSSSCLLFHDLSPSSLLHSLHGMSECCLLHLCRRADCEVHSDTWIRRMKPYPLMAGISNLVLWLVSNNLFLLNALSLSICIAMVNGESNSCQFLESWVLSFSSGSYHLSNLTPVHINSFILNHLVTLDSVFFLMIIISVLGCMIPILWNFV